MKFLCAAIFSSLWTDLSKARSISSPFTTTRANAVKKWLEGEGHEVDIIYNDVGWTEEIESKTHDVLLLHACGGFVTFGGNLSKWHYKLFEYLSTRDPKLWVVHDDCDWPVKCGLSSLKKNIEKINMPFADADRNVARKGILKLEEMFSEKFPVIMPGGRFDLKTLPSENLRWEAFSEPRINMILAEDSFPTILPLEEPLYDTVYAGVWRPSRKKALKKMLDDDRFLSASVYTGEKAANKVSTEELGLRNHVELEGFRYENQQHWYNKSLTQIIISDESNYGKYLSARWFTALRTNSIPLIYSPLDPKREMLKEYPELNFLYVESVDDVANAIKEVKDPKVRKKVLKKIHSMKEPWFTCD
jgi:hypothetical protein